MSDPVTDKRIKKLELELKDLRRELRALRDRVDGLADHHLESGKFGPVKMKEEPWSPF